MKRPGWTSSRVARQWLAVGAVVLLFLAGRAAMRSFGTDATISGGARAYATCKAPWQSARTTVRAKRFTGLLIIPGTGILRAEGVAALGDRCRDRARRRMGLAVVLLAGSGALAWLALPQKEAA